jgi:hypothetical protein
VTGSVIVFALHDHIYGEEMEMSSLREDGVWQQDEQNIELKDELDLTLE